MIYVIGLLYFIWNKRYIILTVLGILLTVLSVVMNIIETNYFGLIMWMSVGVAITINSVLSEFYKQKREEKSRNRHR